MSDPSNIESRIEEAHLLVRDLRLQARVGVNPGERGAEQPVVIDAWVGLEDLELTARSERLRDAVDYVSVVRAVRRVVARRHFPLVETLTHAIAHAVLDRHGVSWVRIRMRKLDCLKDASSAGVVVTLRRDPRQPAVHPIPVDPGQLTPRGEEIVIVGGGAAGLCAALWCWRLGHPALLVDPAQQLGGQLHLVHGLMRDLPALEPMTGLPLAQRLWRQFVGHQGRWLRASLVAVEPPELGCTFEVIGADPAATRLVLRPRAMILTTGVQRRRLEIPGERRLAGRGVLPTAARDIDGLAGERVVVIGGGDSACENALLLAQAGAEVTLVHHDRNLTARDQFRRRVAQEPAITVLLDARATGLVGEEALEGVEITDARGQSRLPARAALVRIGWIPNSEPLPARWLEDRGYVRCDSSGRVEGETHWFAAGDLLGRISPSVATSFGSGSSAASAACLLLETHGAD